MKKLCCPHVPGFVYLILGNSLRVWFFSLSLAYHFILCPFLADSLKKIPSVLM